MFFNDNDSGTERQMAFGHESPQVVQMLVENNLASPELLQMINEKPADDYSNTRVSACQ